MEKQVENVLFIVNRHAGLGYQQALEERISTTCKKNSAHGTVEFTQRRGHATELAREASKNGFTMVVSVGGDGTTNEVAQGLLHSKIPMGIVPRGSGNGLARHLKIPLNTNDAIATLFTHRPVAIDTFTVNGKLSLNVSGIGFDGHVTNLFGVKSTRGFIGYITLTVQEFFKFDEFAVEIITPEKRINTKAFILAIANSSQYGNNALIAPAASVRDGLLHVNLVKKVPLYRLDFVYDFFAGKLEKSSFCDILETNHLTLKTNFPVAYHVDGEPCGTQDSFDIRVLPSSLCVLIPDTHSHSAKI